MPIYEYGCKKCGKHFEIMQKISDKPLAKCKECGGKLEKQWSLSGFQFKGEGWYVTDYSAKGAEAKAEKASTETATSETTKETTASTDESKPKKTESKKESKKETKKAKSKPSAKAS